MRNIGKNGYTKGKMNQIYQMWMKYRVDKTIAATNMASNPLSQIHTIHTKTNTHAATDK